MTPRATHRLALWSVAVLASLAWATPAGAASAANAATPEAGHWPAVHLAGRVSRTRDTPESYVDVYKVQVRNGPNPVTGALVRLVGVGAGSTVVDGIVQAGDLSPRQRVRPADTVTIRQVRGQPLDRRALRWDISARPAPGAAGCAALVDQASNLDVFPPTLHITSATLEAANDSTPEHCNLRGVLNERDGAESSPGVVQHYAIQWQVRLPTDWNGRFAMQGGGGLNGSIPNTTNRLALGYATAASDSGHSNSTNTDPLASAAGAFGTDFNARTDFAYRAIDLTSRVARGLIAAYYGDPATYAYFEGCSMGGREAMMVTQRLPEVFNGVVAGDPAFKFASVSAKSVYVAQTFGQLAASMGVFSRNGVPLASNTYTNQDLQLVSKAVLDACDALDGLTDGMVNQPLACTTAQVLPHLNARVCSGDKTPSCLTTGQIDALLKFYAGPVTPTGRTLYSGFMWDPGIAGCTSAVDCNTPTATNIATGWRAWNLGSFQANPAESENTANAYTAARGGAAATTVVPTPPVLPAPAANEGVTAMMMGYDLDQYWAWTQQTTPEFPESGYAQLETASVDLGRFNAHGGKLLIYQPQTGGPFSPLAMVDWYRDLNTAAGGTDSDFSRVTPYARLFMMPGAQHCGGGPATSSIDPFSAIVQWVEFGNAPDRLIGTAPTSTPWPGRTRPLCVFPATAHYTGSGSIEDAANFVCR